MTAATQKRQTEQLITLSPKATKLYGYLRNQAPKTGDYIFYHRNQFRKATGLTPEEIHLAINELASLKFIQPSGARNSSYRLLVNLDLSKKEPITLNEVESQLLNHLRQQAQQLQLAKYELTPLMQQFGLSRQETRKAIESLVTKGLIRKVPISGVGTCLRANETTPIGQKDIKIKAPKPKAKAKAVHPLQLVPAPAPIPKQTKSKVKASAKCLYFIDTENVNSPKAFDGVKRLKKQDTLLFMLTQNSKQAKLFVDPHLFQQVFGSCLATIESRYQTTGGKNALDFVIISELALRLLKNPSLSICIISEDKGFAAALTHLEQQLGLPKGQLRLEPNFKCL